jgi:phosphate-selective porin OprO/OprP
LAHAEPTAPEATLASAEPPRWRGFRLVDEAHDAELRIRGLLQADGVFLLGDASPSRFEVRRARITLDAKLGRFALRIQPQWTPGGVALLDGYIDARVRDALILRAGKMKTPLGLEMAQSISALIFPERGLTTSLVPTRDLGVQAFGKVAGGILTYAIGVFDGAADGATPDGNIGESFDLAGRVFVEPFRATSIAPLAQLGIGVAGGWGLERGAVTESGLGVYRTITRATYLRYEDGVFADGARFRVNPQLWWYWGPLGLLGEYVYSSQEVRGGAEAARIGDQAFTVVGSYLLTQESASYAGVTPSRSLGAFELDARYDQLDLDDEAIAAGFVAADSPTVVRTWGVGLSYWASTIVRGTLAFNRTTFDGQGAVRAPENALILRIQAQL